MMQIMLLEMAILVAVRVVSAEQEIEFSVFAMSTVVFENRSSRGSEDEMHG